MKNFQIVYSNESIFIGVEEIGHHCLPFDSQKGNGNDSGRTSAECNMNFLFS